MKIDRLMLTVTVFIVTSTMWGQLTPSKQSLPPIRLDKIPAGKLTVPADLSMLGSKYYDFLVAPTGQITVKLYDSKEQPMATVEIQENLSEHSMLLKYTDKDGEDWLSTSMSRSQDEILFVVTSSAGGEMRTKARMGDSKKAGKLRVLSLNLESEKGWKEFPLDGLEATGSRLAAFHALQVEEERLFSTPGLQKLREFIQDFGSLRDLTLQKWSGQPEVKVCNGSTTPRLSDVEPMQGCGGQGFCTRISTVIPIFNCLGGNSCTGFYIVYDYMFSVFFIANCSYLNGCA